MEGVSFLLGSESAELRFRLRFLIYFLLGPRGGVEVSALPLFTRAEGAELRFGLCSF